jgi:hypothetical protein
MPDHQGLVEGADVSLSKVRRDPEGLGRRSFNLNNGFPESRETAKNRILIIIRFLEGNTVI